MAELAPGGEITNQAVHEIMNANFTNPYLQDSHMSLAAYTAPYHAGNPYCDYNQTTWPARPNFIRSHLGARGILGVLFRMGWREISKQAVVPFADRAPEITEALKQHPMLIVNDHDPDLTAALSLYGNNVALARHLPGSFVENYQDMVANSHGVGTRGFAPIIVRPGLPFMDIARWVMNPHTVMPDNKRMRESALPISFKSAYNDISKANTASAAHAEPTHPQGLHAVISTPPAGTKNLKGFDSRGQEIRVTAPIKQGTIDWIRSMEVGLIEYRSEFGRGKYPNRTEIGRIVLPHEVDDMTVKNMMSDIAAFRREHRPDGLPVVYYAEDPEVAEIIYPTYQKTA